MPQTSATVPLKPDLSMPFLITSVKRKSHHLEHDPGVCLLTSFVVGVVSALPEGHSASKLLAGQHPEQLGSDGGAGGARTGRWPLHRQPHQHGLQRHDLAVRQQRMMDLRDSHVAMTISGGVPTLMVPARFWRL